MQVSWALFARRCMWRYSAIQYLAAMLALRLALLAALALKIVHSHYDWFVTWTLCARHVRPFHFVSFSYVIRHGFSRILRHCARYKPTYHYCRKTTIYLMILHCVRQRRTDSSASRRSSSVLCKFKEFFSAFVVRLVDAFCSLQFSCFNVYRVSTKTNKANYFLALCHKTKRSNFWRQL